MNSSEAINQNYIPYPYTFPSITFVVNGQEADMNGFYCLEYPGEELIRPCECDKCMGACNGGTCGECFACEAKADDDHWWAVNRADVLQI